MVGVLALDDVEVDGEDPGQLGGEEREDGHREGRAVSVCKLGLVHRGAWLALRLLAHSTDVEDNADQSEQTCTVINISEVISNMLLSHTVQFKV